MRTACQHLIADDAYLARSRGRPAVWLVMLLLAAAPSALGQADAASTGKPGSLSALAGTEFPLIGIHYHDLTPEDGDAVEVLVPRPALEQWQGANLAVLGDCLELGSLADPGPGHALILKARVVGAGSCRAVIEVAFSDGEASHGGRLLVHLNRVDLPTSHAGLISSFSFDRIAVPGGAGPMAGQTVMFTLWLQNDSEQTLTVPGLADPGSLSELFGATYRYSPDSFDGTLESLQAGSPLAAEQLAPGGRVGYAVVVDPELGMPDGSRIISAQLAVPFESGGITQAVRLGRVVVAWGNELP